MSHVARVNFSVPMTDLFDQEMLKEHNRLRALHNVPPLKLNREICAVAQRYSERLMKIDKLQHSYDDDKYGENLYVLSSSKPLSDELIAQKACAAWYSEINKYKFGKDSKDGSTGHFTQLIWNDTKELGVGHSTKINEKGEKTFVVCNYFPPGNFIGKFAENVPPLPLPPKS